MSLYSVSYHNDIQMFFKKILTIESDELSQTGVENIYPIERINKKEEPKKDQIKIEIPKYLVKKLWIFLIYYLAKNYFDLF